MIGTLRAFMWLRWRLLANALRGGQRRDRLEQISRILAMFAPVIFVALSLGSVLLLSVAGYWAGHAIATERPEAREVLLIVRIALAVLTAVVVFFAFWTPSQSSLSRYTRLLLLPVSARTLHLVEFVSSLADPWIVFVAPGLMTFAVGLAVGGKVGTALVAAVAGLVLLVVFAGIGSLISFGITWLFRSRRRSELFTLIFVMALALLSLVPAMLSGRLGNERREALVAGREQPDEAEQWQRWLTWTQVLPSEIYGRAVSNRLAGRRVAAGAAVGLLAGQAAVFFLASGLVHRRMIGGVEGDRSRRAEGARPVRHWRVPLLGPAASAVAVAQVRTAMRSVRGRLSILLPGPLLAALTVVLSRMPAEESFAAAVTAHGHLLFGTGVLISIYSFQVFSLNLFGTDRAGLTMQFLQPISHVELARGKLAGLAMVIGATAGLCLVAALAAAPGGDPLLWVAVLAGGAATYLWLMPVFIWLSALFPVAADLSKTGSAGNPHGLTMFVGMVVVAVAALPVVAVVLAAQYWFRNPIVAVVAMGVWLVLALAVSVPLVSIAARTIVLRRENLAVVAQGR